jgi:ribosomal peptide maturation radical SAM protein 1
MEYFKTLLPKLVHAERPYNIFFETKANLREHHVKALRKAGVTCIQPGIESLNSHILTLINKGTKTYQSIQLLKWCRQYGIHPTWFMLYDIPGEKDEWFLEIAAMLPLLSHLQPPASMLQIIFERYSTYHTHAKDYNLHLQPPKTCHKIYPLSTEELQDIVCFFEEKHQIQYTENRLPQHMGLKAVFRGVSQWRKVFYSEDSPVLSMITIGSNVQIHDTRPIAYAPSMILNGLEAEIYLACNEAMRVERIYETFGQKGKYQAELDDTIGNLIERKIMLRVDDRLLSLAFQAHFIPRKNPNGIIPFVI